ncbi:cancer-related nucleoside-triphosphatase-like protein [Leptotrombidium deliense]|uniref:Cancer-related nucleoside-triphosphatase-like protein n=1 Tax=Leptotrombidium deliense TaxID=299467 RepID=A0A443SRT9_9ACAR|nr:cancer-related nucleoside-triphosphatase-like protein [Leptotrombidium deliense]
MEKIRRILITGEPGIGKTTAIKKISEILESRNIKFKGIYTSEIREDGNRVGFNIINIKSGDTLTMASVAKEWKGPKVGKYTVNVDAVESVALSALQPPTDYLTNIVYFIDEIGKMELFSEKFKKAVQTLFSLDAENIRIIATVPSKRNIQEVEEIRRSKHTTEIIVTRKNRGTIVDHVLHVLDETGVK